MCTRTLHNMSRGFEHPAFR